MLNRRVRGQGVRDRYASQGRLTRVAVRDRVIQLFSRHNLLLSRRHRLRDRDRSIRHYMARKSHITTLGGVIANTRKVYELFTQARGRAYFGLNRVLLTPRGQRLNRPFHPGSTVGQRCHLVRNRERSDVLKTCGQQIDYLKIAHTRDRLKRRLNGVVDLIARELRHALKGIARFFRLTVAGAL